MAVMLEDLPKFMHFFYSYYMLTSYETTASIMRVEKPKDYKEIKCV